MSPEALGCEPDSCIAECHGIASGSEGLNGVHDALRVVVAFHRLKAAVEQRKPEEVCS